MSGYPFPADRQAAGRLDWCGESGGGQAALCVLRARQCGSHISATGDAAWAERAGPVLSRLLAPPSLSSWRPGPCFEASGQGVCGLLAASAPEAPQLWSTLGAPREKAIYDEALGGGPTTASPGDGAELR